MFSKYRANCGKKALCRLHGRGDLHNLSQNRVSSYNLQAVEGPKGLPDLTFETKLVDLRTGPLREVPFAL